MIQKLTDSLRREFALARFLRQPLPAPELPSWIFSRLKADQKPWRTVMGFLLPELLTIPDDDLPINIRVRINDWNTWFVNERAWDTAVVWLALWCFVLFLTTQSGARQIMMGFPELYAVIKILGVVCFIGFWVYLRKATAYNNVKIALWDRTQP